MPYKQNKSGGRSKEVWKIKKNMYGVKFVTLKDKIEYNSGNLKRSKIWISCDITQQK